MTDQVKNAFTTAGTVSGTATGLATDLLQSALGTMSPLNKYGRYMTGSRAIIKVNGELFGFAMSVSYNIQTTASDVKTIDSWVPWELAPSMISVSGTLGMFHIPGKGPAVTLTQANLLSFLDQKYITIEISDRTTGNLVFKTERAMVVGKSQSLNAGALSTIELQWRAIGWSDEMVPTFPTSTETNPNDPNAALTAGIKKLFK